MNNHLLKVADWERLAGDAGYKPKALASLCSVPLRRLERFFKRRFGRSPTRWMRDLRCRKAADLISRGCQTSAAARKLRFANASHFCHEFKKAHGVSPQSFAPRGRVMKRQADIVQRSDNARMPPGGAE